MRHLLNFKDWPGEELLELLERALRIKQDLPRYDGSMRGKTLAMIFQKTSTRTRLSFESGLTKLGGHAVYMDWRSTNLVLAELKDEIRYISGNADLVMARLLHHADLAEMAAYSSVPIINGCDDRYHPCQAFADLLTIREKLGRVRGIKLVYVGVWNNVLNSLIDICHRVGAYLVAITPVVNEPSRDEELAAAARETGFFRQAADLRSETGDADAIYTDSWVDMEFFLDPKFEAEKKKRIDLMLPFQLNADNLAGSKALIMHDMPIHVGYEIDRATIEDGRSIIFPQSWNRMHGQNALMLRLLGLI